MLPRIRAAAVPLGALLLAAGPAAALYAYVPNVLVLTTADDVDLWLDEIAADPLLAGEVFEPEASLGTTASDDPIPSDRKDLKRVDQVAKVMGKHWVRLDRDCDPNAVFALMYLITTYGVRQHIAEEYFDDNDYLALITVTFAKMYLDAYDAWEAGHPEDAPTAWVEAFDWAASGQSTIVEDQFLGMNAHINYDLGVAIAAHGTLAPDGTSRKADMDRINHVLTDVTDDVQYWLAYYYGPEAPTTPPSQEHTDATWGLDNGNWPVLEAIFTWREQAWNNAVAIELTAGDPTAREAWDEQMDASSGATALGLQTPKLESTAPDRIAYCETHG